MSKSVYVVSNVEQENNVLKALIESGYKHPHTEKYKYSFVPSINGSAFDGFPYEIIADKEEHNIYWRTIPKQMINVSQLNRPDELIIYDGREENDKMKISKEVYDALMEWRDIINKSQLNNFVGKLAINHMEGVIYNWWSTGEISDKEGNNRLIAIIRWVSGEDVFEVEKPKKWVVRSKKTYPDGTHRYVQIIDDFSDWQFDIVKATRFDTKEEAESWANAHQEVIEVKE